LDRARETIRVVLKSSAGSSFGVAFVTAGVWAGCQAEARKERHDGSEGKNSLELHLGKSAKVFV
jgi:hypothetical protein